MSALVNSKTKKYAGRHLGRDIDIRSASRFMDSERALIGSDEDAVRANVEALSVEVLHTPMSDLDLMIANGWGDTLRGRLPADWRTRRRT